MKKDTHLRLSVALVFLSFCVSTFGQKKTIFWSPVKNVNVDKRIETKPLKETFFRLDIEALKQTLKFAPERKSSKGKSNVIIDFPNALGEMDSFKIFKASVLHQDLQERYPELGSFIGQNLKTPSEIIRFSISPFGLKSVTLGSSYGTQYIDLVSKIENVYSSFFRRDLPSEVYEFECGFIDEDFIYDRSTENKIISQKKANDGQLREFRLALACTQEYAAVHVNAAGLNGGTDAQKKAAVLTKMNDVMTRVNAVYENELSVSMVIVPTNENVIFISSPFLDNTNYTNLINQSQTFIDAFINAPYDIGHMLTTGGGGVAQLFSPCTGNKARAISGVTSGGGAEFESILIHEMGHQFGSPHTFNGTTGNCDMSNISPSTAYETGSGTTIMSYAGICGSQNVQSNRDLYFHQKSLQMMWDNITSGNSQCARLTPTLNSTPTSNAGASHTIPIGTPYKLTGGSTDADGINTHTYTWEQYDLGPAGVPAVTTTTGPIVRSFPPKFSPIRYIPRLEDYVSNVNASTTWEKLVILPRQMNFRLTVRDNDVRGGQVAVDDMIINTIDSGGVFNITSQNTAGIVYMGGTDQNVTWNVAGTTGSGINTANVNILLSIDGGLNFNTILLSNTANDGLANVTIPNISAANCRIMVEAVGSVFYNINSMNFEIGASLNLGEEDFLGNLSIYPNPNKGEFNVKFNTLGQHIKIEIFDVFGRLITSRSFNESGKFDQVIKINHPQSGLYLLNITDRNRIVTKKIIIN
ncbi:MAG: hypothetical protein ACI9OE_001036 [Mariniflexile sp.]|jgi:hypothetical protein